MVVIFIIRPRRFIPFSFIICKSKNISLFFLSSFLSHIRYSHNMVPYMLTGIDGISVENDKQIIPSGSSRLYVINGFTLFSNVWI